MILAHFFVAKTIYAHSFVTKTIYALFCHKTIRLESFCALNFAIRKVQTFWASAGDYVHSKVFDIVDVSCQLDGRFMS